MTYQEMIEMTRVAIRARNSARDELAERLESMIDDIDWPDEDTARAAVFGEEAAQ